MNAYCVRLRILYNSHKKKGFYIIIKKIKYKYSNGRL